MANAAPVVGGLGGAGVGFAVSMYLAQLMPVVETYPAVLHVVWAGLFGLFGWAWGRQSASSTYHPR